MLQASLLGQFQVLLDDEPIQMASRPAQTLLAYLLLNSRTSHHRGQLASLLWPDSYESSARKNLRNAVWQLRKAIGEHYLLFEHGRVAFNTAAPHQLDITILADDQNESSSDALIKAISLYKGELLPGFYEDWVQLERERLQAIFERRMQALLDQLSAAARWPEVKTWAEYWIGRGHTPEPAYRALMLAHAAYSDLAGVATTYQRCVRALRLELDVPPSAATQALYQRLCQGEMPLPEPVAGEPPAAVQAPGVTAAAPAVITHHLPPQLTPFVGREKEQADVQQLLQGEPERRLVTILGPGGIGKTRLSLEAAAAMKDAFAHGVHFVPLAPVKSADHLMTTLAESIGFRFYQGGDPKQQLLDYLRQKQMLLVMDNFEHLLPGAWQVTELLLAAPSLKILVTSRERLNLSGEAVYTLGSMAFPAAEDVQNAVAYGAVQLLMHSARLVRPDLDWAAYHLPQMARICRLVEGMPLALVLAAGWLEVLSFKEIADEIEQSLDFLESEARDLPERQRNMRATFDYSWKRLPSEERQTFMQLSVFRGGFTRQAAQAVTGAGLRVLRTLVNKSFLSLSQDGRYHIHELLRQFGEEHLVASGAAAATRQAHCDYYLTLLHGLEDSLHGPSQVAARAEIEADIENVRAGWNRALESAQAAANSEQSELLVQAIEPLAAYHELAGLLQEGERLFQRAAMQVEAGSGDTSSELLCRLLIKYVSFALGQGFLDTVKPSIDKAMALANGVQEEKLLAELAFIRGSASRYTGALNEAIAHLEQAVALYEAAGQKWRMIPALNQLGESQGRLQLPQQALVTHQRALQIATELGDVHAQALSLGYIGGDYYFKDDYQMALWHYERAVTLFEQLDDVPGLARVLANAAFVHNLLGDYEQALQKIELAIPLYRQSGIWHSEAIAHDTLGEIHFARGDYEAARQAFLYALRYAQVKGQQWETSWTQTNLGLLHITTGEYERAEAELLQALALRQANNNPKEIAVTTGVLAMLYRRTGRHQEALAHFDKAIDSLRRVGERYHLAGFLVERGALLLDLGKPAEADAAVKEGMALARAIGRKQNLPVNWPPQFSNLAPVYGKIFE